MSSHSLAAPAAYAYPLLIKQLLHTSPALHADQEIVYRDSHRYRYRDFRARLDRLANALSVLGAEPGSVVAVMDWDSHRYLECYFAVPMMGAVLMSVNVRLSPDQIAYCLDHAEAELLLIHHEFLPILEQIRGKLTRLKAVVLLADGAEVPFPAGLAGEYEALLAAAGPSFDFPDFDENARATTFYTTGTTGNPKAVAFSHRQLVLHTLAVGLAFGSASAAEHFGQDDVYMPLTPMFHVHAWGFPYIATLLGVKQVYPGRYLPDLILKLVATEGVTYSHCVPAIMQMLLACPAAATTDLGRWKVVIGGSALPLGLARQMIERGIEVWAGYGMSETCPVVTLAQAKPGMPTEGEAALVRKCRTGKPIPLVDLRVVDPEMRDVPADGKSVGEVVLRTPWLTQGYVGNPEASAELWRGGYLHTQDVGFRDADGYLQVTDRLKDVIKTGGEWVSSLHLESLVSQHPAVAEVAVIGVPDARWGERPLVLVVPRQGREAEASEVAIRRHLELQAEAGHLARYAVPDRVQIVAAIDKTSVGKIDKKLLRQKYGQA
jgi:fatty-acyl-CoA synthase